MKIKLQRLISREDKRNPLTDHQLAEELSTRREEITQLRHDLSIPDSRKRRWAQLTADTTEILARDPNISTRALTNYLQHLGFEVSRYVAGQLLKEMMARNLDPVQKFSREPEAFINLIGWDGSLRTQIQQAKAAVVYPPTGLHTLILGESGVGKSELAEAMYRYSLESGQRLDKSPFVVFNCADYAENPQLLISQLFGHTRSAYTGATEDKVGLVEKADGGLLFLDEIHRLPPEGQEILYSIIDRGCYRRLGETDNWRKVDLMLIAATTEELDSSLLLPFRRRIPMVIELPPLRSRPLMERLEIILCFFRQEATRVGKKLVVQKGVLRALMSGEKPGNVGQIKSDVQVACARGFLNHFEPGASDEVIISLNELSSKSRQALLEGQDRQRLEELLPKDKVFYPGSDEQKARILRDNIYDLPDEIYVRIEELVEEGRKQGLSPENTNQWVSEQLEVEFSSIINRIESIKASLTRLDLETVVGPGFVSVMTEVVKIASSELDINDQHLFFYLAIHLHTALERIRSGKPIINPQLSEVKKNFEREYLTAIKIAPIIKREFGITLPDEEIGFIALYLRTFSIDQSGEGRVAVLVLSHGRIAREMVSVVHSLLKVDHAHGLDMSLTERPEDFLQRVLDSAKAIEQGKGILLLVDMGSLITFGEIIEKELGIRVRVIDRVDLVMVLEATRWSMLAGARLDEIANDLEMSKFTSLCGSKPQPAKQLIVAVCLSGIGGAEKIRIYLEKILDDTEIEIKTVGVMDEKRLKRKLEEWEQTYSIIAIVGTINPEIKRVPFIPFQSVTEKLGADYLMSLLNKKRAYIGKNSGSFASGLIAINKPWKDKQTIINSLGNLLMHKGVVQEGFIESVFEREEAAPTCMQGGIAIPHADPKHVLQPAIAVATLETPVNWGGIEVDVVFLLALRISDRQLFANLLKVFSDKQRMERIRIATSVVAIEEEINNVFS